MMNTIQFKSYLSNFIPKGAFYFNVIPSDYLNRIKSRRLAIIVNTDRSDSSGTHWIAFFRSGANSKLQYFDSFGLPIQFYGEDFVNFVYGQGGILESNSKQWQPNMTTSCGDFCLFFLYQRYNNIPFKKIQAMFHKKSLRKNHFMVTNFVKKKLQGKPKNPQSGSGSKNNVIQCCSACYLV